MANHLVTSVLSLGLSVAFILCVVALVVNNTGKLEDEHFMNTKAVYTICKPTDYNDHCKHALTDVGKNTSATKKDYIFATIHAAISGLQAAIDKSASTRKGLQDTHAESDLSNCERLLGYAADDLNHLLDVAHKNKVAKLADQIDPILLHLTAARAYQTTCIDEIKDEKLKKEMQEALDSANKNTYNSEKIIYNIPDILMDFGVDLGSFELAGSGHRRLLDEVHAISHEGFPSWFSAADHRLLGDQPTGHGFYRKPQATDQGFFRTPEPKAIKSTVKPDAVVATDGGGKFKSIKEALASYSLNQRGRYIIYVKAGVYDEGQIIVNRTQNNVYMYGDGRDKTVITGDLSYGIAKLGTSQTATFVAQGERFMAKSIGFQNTIGESGQHGVAFLSESPHTVMVDCSFEGYQDTLYYHTHDQFYKNCSIYGTLDFIFGSGRAFIQDTEIYVRKPAKTSEINTITADGKMKEEEAGGVVLQNCKIKAAKELEEVRGKVKTYLGRPWKPCATAVVMQCNIGGFIDKEGWSEWEEKDSKNHEACMFREYSNKGAGSNTDDRVKWEGFKAIQNKKEASRFTADPFMDAESWLPQAGVTVKSGFKN